MGLCHATPHKGSTAALLASQQQEKEAVAVLDAEPPKPELDEEVLGITGPELHQSEKYKELVDLYNKKQPLLKSHERTMQDFAIINKVEEVIADLENKRVFGHKAVAEQDKILRDNGDEDLEKNLAIQNQGHHQEWVQRKLELSRHAVHEALTRVISEDLKTDASDH
eukprot:gene2057-3147_t